MRLIGTITNKKFAEEFSYFLAKEGILNQCEVHTNSDWGSVNYGDTSCGIWIYDEDQVEKAEGLLAEFNRDPEDPKYRHHQRLVEMIEPAPSPQPPIEGVDEPKKERAAIENPLGRVTLFIILLCTWIFTWGTLTTPTFPETISNGYVLPLLMQPEINKALEYDYPKTFQIIDKLAATYGPEKVLNPNELPPEGQYYFEEFLHTPFWQGLYTYIVASYHGDISDAWNFKTPMFEKIREGEVWRPFTPVLLHANVIHILFNLIWLVVLGKQMERCLGAWRYCLFILMVGIFSNTAQYLMGGANFMGISGVLCGMVSFIWMRQRYAAWEGYDLQPGTFVFFMFFISIMAGIQLISFFMELFFNTALSPGIANTAHLSGAFAGFILGRMKFFSWSLK